MDRRAFLAAAAGSAAVASAGCLDRIPGVGLDASFERTSAELAVGDRPDVTVDGGTVTVRGTVAYGSSECGTVDLAHAAYEDSQARLDLLVAAVDDSRWQFACSDDIVETGYRVEATVPDDCRRVAATEHHLFGEAYSTTADLTDW